MINNIEQYDLFNIEYVKYAPVGNKKLYKGDKIIIHNWNTTLLNPLSNIDHYRIYWILEGSAIVITKDEKIELKAGNMYFFPANTIVATKCNVFMDHLYIHFTTNNAINYINLITYKNGIPIDDTTKLAFENLYTLRNKEKNSFANILEMNGYLRILLSRFFECTETVNPKMVQFNPVLEYIKKNISRNITLDDLSQIIGYTPEYFSYSFSKIFNISPSKYIKKERLFLAKKLLLNSELSISEIAIKCGFDNQYYFTNWFTKEQHMNPSQYRKTII